MNLTTLDGLLGECLKDIFSAENQILKALPRMAKAASSESLKEAFLAHVEETKGQVGRLEEIAKSMGVKLSGKKCKAMEGLIEEGKELLDAEGEEALIDAALIVAAQKIEHYEISAYGSARTLAEKLELEDVVALLQETLDEESAADEKLSQLSVDEILEGFSDEEDDAEEEDDDEDEGEDDEADEEEEEEEEEAPKRPAGKKKK